MLQSFQFAGYMRIVLTVPEEQIIEACARMSEFCSRYYKSKEECPPPCIRSFNKQPPMVIPLNNKNTVCKSA